MTPPRQTILVLDDEALIGMEVEAVLHDAGFSVAGPAVDIEEGLALIDRCRLDGAILDLNLAGQRSDPVADRLIERDIPFAYLTGEAEGRVNSRHRAAPVIAKPFAERRLRTVLARLLSPAPVR